MYYSFLLGKAIVFAAYVLQDFITNESNKEKPRGTQSVERIVKLEQPIC